MNLANRPAAPDAVRLPESLDLRAADPLAAAILSRRGDDLDLDAGDVRRAGGLCAQVLLSAHDSWAADGRRLTLVNPSPSFREVLELLGVLTPAQPVEQIP